MPALTHHMRDTPVLYMWSHGLMQVSE